MFIHSDECINVPRTHSASRVKVIGVGVHIYQRMSTLYVGLARKAPPINTNFQLTLLLTQLQEALYEDLTLWSIKFAVYHLFSSLSSIAEVNFWCPAKNRHFLRFFHNNNYHNQLLQTGFTQVYLVPFFLRFVFYHWL